MTSKATVTTTGMTISSGPPRFELTIIVQQPEDEDEFDSRTQLVSFFGDSWLPLPQVGETFDVPELVLDAM